MTETVPDSLTRRPSRLPIGGLLAIAAAGFLTAMLETMPAGILPEISRGLGVEQSAAGQMVTVYAIGSIVGAIPIISATMGWPRRRLLVMVLIGFLVTSLLVAWSPWFALTLVARFITGLFAGVMWGIAAGYAARVTPEEHRGRGMTIALSGPPIALAIGTPLAALVSGVIGWRMTFVVIAVITAAILIWVVTVLPDFPGQPKGERTSVATALRRPGVAIVIITSVLFVVGHYMLYTYSSSFLVPLGMENQVSAVLLTFGIAALIALWISGIFIDRHLRKLMLISIFLFAASMLVLAFLSASPALVYIGVAGWGVAFGFGGTTIPQKALTDAAGSAVDVAQSVLVTGWNVGIAAGGVLGGIVLSATGAGSIPWAPIVFLVPVLILVLVSKRNAYPSGQKVPGA